MTNILSITICSPGIITDLMSITDLDWWLFRTANVITCLLDNCLFPMHNTVASSFLDEGLITFFKGYAEMIWQLIGG